MENLGIICHDAGGAEIISHWLKYQKINPLIHLQGPAVKVFKRVLGHKRISSLDYLISNCNKLILGTSWQSDLEKRSFIYARENKISKIIVVFDHWIDYRERLIYKNYFLDPDEIWVADLYARRIAEKYFPSNKISIIKNYYLEEIKNKYEKYKFREEHHNKILFIGDNSSEYQNSRNSSEIWNYDEIKNLEFFLKNINSLGVKKPELIIRPHPSETKSKYFEIIKRFKSINIKFSDNDELIDDLLITKIVIGADSMALFVASFLGKKVISIIPKKGKKMTIPTNNMERLEDLIK